MAEVGSSLGSRALQVATQVCRLSLALQQTAVHPAAVAAVLCLMRLRRLHLSRSEVRLREHHELRAALPLQAVPDYTTLYRFLRRLEDDDVDRGCRKRARLRRRRAEPFLPPSTARGSPTLRQHFFLRVWSSMRHGPSSSSLVEGLIVVDVQQQILLAQRARQGPGATRVLCRDCSMCGTRCPLGWCWQMRSLTPKPTPAHSATPGSEEHHSRRRRGVPNGAIRN